jgi:Ca-activated chloride channel homolog
MKKLSLGAICLLLLNFAAFTQTTRTTRPRVAPTPTPQIQSPQTVEPTLRNGTTTTTDRRPPVLSGGTRQSTPQISPTSPAGADDSDGVIRVETNLVTMPVSVVDRDGRFVSGLQAKDFQIFENGAQQKVEYFQSVEQPFTVILMIDVSPSTQYQIDEIQNAAISFVDQLRANDRVEVISFDDRVRILARPTNDRRQLRYAIQQAEFGDGTSLYEAVDQVINRELKAIQGRKAVVLFTDGVDTTSRRASFESTLADVEETDALFYTIRYNTQRDNFGGGWGGGGGMGGGRGDIGDILGIIMGGGRFPQGGGGRRRGGGGGMGNRSDYETGRQYLETLALRSGGRTFEADTLTNLDSSFAGIAEELRRQYSLGYYPENPGQMGERKQIKVRVMRPNLVVKAKTTYIVGQSADRLAGK